jgi:hypothetical protein
MKELVIMTRMMMLSIASALVVSVVATATASAHEFLVEGSAVTSLVDGTFTSATSHFRWVLLGTDVDVVSNAASGTFSLSPEGGDAETISFTSLALYETNAAGEDTALLSKCVVNEGRSMTFSVNSKLTELGGELVDAFEGLRPPLIVEFPILGTSCAVKKAINEITGSVDALLPEGEVSKILHSWEFRPSASGSQSLEFSKSPATFESKESLVLGGSVTGRKWSLKK